MSSAQGLASIEERVQYINREFVNDRMGRIRQAGTIGESGESVDKLRQVCERSLYHFCLFILGRQYLTPTLHFPICNWLTQTPPFRKMLLLPRNHAKTSLVAHGLPLHIIIQPEGGRYMPHKRGTEMRIMLAGETSDRAMGNMSVLRNVMETNTRFRGLWPHAVWENPRKQASKWNEGALTVPRDENYPDPTILAIGVSGAVVGARHDVHIKDDLVTEKAANSPTIMETAISWHTNSRAMFDNQDESLEFIIGTRWAVHDLYSYIIQNDSSVSPVLRSIIEDEVIIYPEAFTPSTIERLRTEFKTMFALMYMNNVGDPDLVDFTEEDLRFFCLDGIVCSYEQTAQDDALAQRYQAQPDEHFFEVQRNDSFNDHFDDFRENFFRFRS